MKPLSTCNMNVDEVVFKKGHRYITMTSDRDGQALALTDGGGTESLDSYLRSLTDSQLLSIKTLSMDMSVGYKGQRLTRLRKSDSTASMWLNNWARLWIKPARMNIPTCLLKADVRQKEHASCGSDEEEYGQNYPQAIVRHPERDAISDLKR